MGTNNIVAIGFYNPQENLLTYLLFINNIL